MQCGITGDQAKKEDWKWPRILEQPEREREPGYTDGGFETIFVTVVWETFLLLSIPPNTGRGVFSLQRVLRQDERYCT